MSRIQAGWGARRPSPQSSMNSSGAWRPTPASTHFFAATASNSAQLASFKGKLVEEGPVREVLRNPRHEYTRNLLAAVPGAR